ncbi:hypothetical protein M8C21_007708 [Ambrosia artemisiifolia]|uniref:U3 small nucleolar RNA-associated protein 6 homolog n=1 Tax=Ambrosia artemisiifolia TaxID=4212 RepID=A0AAD5GNK6_AMBAR|nr:hypothetical protein M8C21_007708 [Ambrosia artemisiifolia]
MADVVQYKLERMVNELDDLERRGIFSRREIAEIVKQRRKFEYRLKRPSPLKQDYIAYIDYEKAIDALRILRKKAVTRELKKKDDGKGDIELWFQYLEFCRQRRHGHMKKVLAQVIRFHPKVPGVWIYAASWEFDHNLNAAAARALMQSGLRSCPHSEALWVEYLRMELTYLNKLSARRAALGDDVGALVSDPGRKSTQDLRREITPDQLFYAVQVYDKALKVLPSSAMFDLYIKFLMETIGRGGHSKSSTLSGSSGKYIDPVAHVLMIFDKAQSLGCISEDLACQHVSFLLQLGRLDDARNLAEKLCDGELSAAVNLWVLRLSIEMKRIITPSKADLSYVFDLIQNPLKKISVAQAENLWLMGLKYFSNHKHYFDKLVDISLSSLIRDGGSDDGFSLSSAIVNFVLQKDGIQSARDMYKRLFALPRPGLALYRNCIEIELNLASSAGAKKVNLVEARKIYEAALSTYDQDVSLWQDYHSMESKMGTSETAAAVHWRARKILKNNAKLLI